MKWLLVAVLALVGVVGMVLAIGWLLPREHVASVRANYRQTPEAIWAVVTDFEAGATWRSGLEAVKRAPDQNGHPVWVETSSFGDMPLEVEELAPPTLLRTRIADPNLPFGGTWTYEISGTGNGCTVTLTERGEIYNPLFRFLSRFVFGYHGTMETYLKDLGRKFGEDVSPARVQ